MDIIYTRIDDYIFQLRFGIDLIKRDLNIIKKLINKEFDDLFKNDIIISGNKFIKLNEFEELSFLEKNNEYLNNLIKKTAQKVSHDNRRITCICIRKYLDVLNNKGLVSVSSKNTYETYRNEFINELKENKFFYTFIEHFYVYELKEIYDIVNHSVNVLIEFEKESTINRYKRSSSVRISYDNVERLYKMNDSLNEFNREYFNIFGYNIFNGSVNIDYITMFNHLQKTEKIEELKDVLSNIYEEFNVIDYSHISKERKELYANSIKRLIEIEKDN